MTGLSKAALQVYAGNGPALAARYEAVDAEAVFALLAGLLPPPGTMLDLGAGTGRDAAWFAAHGFVVTAVEPTDSLRRIGEDRSGAAVAWISDTLPELKKLAGQRFSFVLLNAVWHHLDAAERDRAMARLAELTQVGGRVLIALRQGGNLPGQPVEHMEPDAEIARGLAAGFVLAGRREPAALQDADRAAGVTWVWLALERTGGQDA